MAGCDIQNPYATGSIITSYVPAGVETDMSESIELLSEIRDWLQRIAIHLVEISGKLDNVGGIQTLDDVVTAVNDAKDAVNDAKDDMGAQLTNIELTLSSIEINTTG